MATPPPPNIVLVGGGTTPNPGSNVYQAETAVVAGGTVTENTNGGYSGSGYINSLREWRLGRTVATSMGAVAAATSCRSATRWV